MYVGIDPKFGSLHKKFMDMGSHGKPA